jgi:hypothetical protein
MEKSNKTDSYIITSLNDFLNENNNAEEKFFKITDKSGRGVTVENVNRTHIEKHWDLDEEDWTSDVTLGDFLDDCYIGDTWETNNEEIECTAIK